MTLCDVFPKARQNLCANIQRKMRTMHIVQRDKIYDKKELENAARRRVPTYSWIVPKAAMPGDEVVTYIGECGFFAIANINSKPQSRSNWKNRYGATLAHVRLIEPP